MINALKFIAIAILVLAVFSFIASNVSEIYLALPDRPPVSQGSTSYNPNAGQNQSVSGDSVHSPHIFFRRGQAFEDDQDKEYVELELAPGAPGPIDITDWTVAGEANSLAFQIGKVRNIPEYDDDRSVRNTILSPGDTVYIGTSISPVKDSFQTSMCTGYFEQHKTFAPSLKRDCPRAFTDEELDDLGLSPDDIEDDIQDGRDVTTKTTCYNYLKWLGNCTDPVGTPDPETISGSCEDFIKSINYEKCVDDHRSDPEYFHDRWYIYLGVKFRDIWDDDSDTISLYDEHGALVAEQSY